MGEKLPFVPSGKEGGGTVGNSDDRKKVREGSLGIQQGWLPDLWADVGGGFWGQEWRKNLGMKADEAKP